MQCTSKASYLLVALGQHKQASQDDATANQSVHHVQHLPVINQYTHTDAMHKQSIILIGCPWPAQASQVDATGNQSVHLVQHLPVINH
jgi:inner membrane protein involved in colicin E2 resistance